MEVINVHPLVLLGVISRKSTSFVPFLNMKKMSIQTLVCDRNVWVIIWTDSKFKKSFMVRGEFHCNWNVFGSGRIRLCNYSLCIQTSGLVVLPSIKRISTYPTFSFRFDQRLILKQGEKYLLMINKGMYMQRIDVINVLSSTQKHRKPRRWRVGAFAPQAEGWVFESQPRQTLVVGTGSDSFIAKRSAKGCECHGSSEMTILNGCPVSQYMCGTLKNPHCSMAMSAEHRSKFAALHRG